MASVAKFTKTKKEISSLPSGLKERANALLSKIMFMESELEKLQSIIAEKGWTEEYQNGANQRGIKKCSEGETYNAMIKNYTAAVSQLNKILPDGVPQEDELMGFISGPK